MSISTVGWCLIQRSLHSGVATCRKTNLKWLLLLHLPNHVQVWLRQSGNWNNHQGLFQSTSKVDISSKNLLFSNFTSSRLYTDRARTLEYNFHGIVQYSQFSFIIFAQSVKTNFIFFLLRTRILNRLYQLASPSFFMVKIKKGCVLSDFLGGLTISVSPSFYRVFSCFLATY